MNTLEAIAARHSYRGTYLSTPVPREHLKAILEAGCAAPSGCNKQTTSLIAVDDPEKIAELFTVIKKGLGKTAPAMICVLTQKIIAYRDRTFYIQDYSAAIENMLLAISDLGYASCWVEGHVTGTERIGDKMAAMLGVPEDYELVCYLPVGIPAEEIPVVEKKPLEERAWFNGFGKTE
ncbi:MAG: nitroreductase family protein [Oscillospiraceae bacterium]|nr:nitroreductase family protein [Oscillospiraceae bacterium]